ncbi:unnamed protein product [Scytosiphon promiscuus]
MHRFRLWAATLCLLLEAAVSTDVIAIFQPPFESASSPGYGLEGHVPLAAQDCPSNCADVFPKLDRDNSGVQDLKVHELGEPKSGTGVNYEMATQALAHACMHLQRAYGEKSCLIEWNFANRTLMFEPYLAADNPGPCACDGVERVTIRLSNSQKHGIPVGEECGYAHKHNFAPVGREVCRGHSGSPLQDHSDVRSCVKESNCEYMDRYNDEQQIAMAILRDPRAVAVSSYFHQMLYRPDRTAERFESIESFVKAWLPTICQWFTVRYVLFTELLGPGKAEVFWYEDSQHDQVAWFHQFFAFVGLSVPDAVVRDTIETGSNGGGNGKVLGFPSKGIDPHEGGEAAKADRTYRDEVDEATAAHMDDVLRVWLPPDLLGRFEL